MAIFATEGKAILVDLSKCTGCRACQVACKQWNCLPAEDTYFNGNYQNPHALSGVNLTVTEFIEHENGNGLRWYFFINRCRQCENAYCKAACPLHAIKRHPTRGTYIDHSICDPDLCLAGDPDRTIPRACQYACPYGVPQCSYVPQGGGAPIHGKMSKCTFCYDRRDPVLPDYPDLWRDPACVNACAPRALRYGPAWKMKKKAKNRKLYLKAHGYPNAKIYTGKSSANGTHVIWVLLDDFSVYGLDGT